MQRDLWGFVVVLLALASTPALALAQEPDADARQRAGDLFAQGERASAGRRWEEALDFFRQSDSVAPHPATRFNIAVCLEKLDRLVEAEVVLHELETSDDEPTVRSAQEALGRIGPKLATVHVEAGDAEISVDGTACPVPCERRLVPGEHTVEASSSEGRQSESVTLAAGETRSVEIAIVAAPPPEPAPATPSHPASPRRWNRILFWSGVGLAAVGVVTTAIFAIRAVSLESDLEAARARGPDPATLDDAQTSATIANVGLAVAGLGAIAIGLSFVLDLDGAVTEAR